MSCSNPNCGDYVPNCSNYAYVCPSCTDCCTEIINAKCVKYTGASLSCIPAVQNDTLEAILIAMNTTMCDLGSLEYDIQCLGGASNATTQTTIQALINDACTVNTNLFDTTCLGGAADRTVFQAVSQIITKICASSATYPSFNATCLGGNAVENLTDTVQLLLDTACTGPTYTVDWDALVAPSPDTNTPLQDILDAIVDNMRCNTRTFDADQFNVTTNANCTKEIELDIPEVSQQILDNIEVTPAQVTQLRDMGLAKMLANETCEKNSIEEKLIFSPKFHVTTQSLTPHSYTLINIGNGGGSNVFEGIYLPNGIYKSETFLLSNPSGIQTWLNALNYETAVDFVVTAIIGGITITVTMDGDLTDHFPIVIWKNTGASTTLLQSSMSGAQQSASVCNSLKIDIDAPAEWTPVSYQNLWDGGIGGTDPIMYRYNAINNTVELRPGLITKSINPNYISSLTELAFTIPHLSDGRAVWPTHGILVSSCFASNQTDCVVNSRVRLDSSTGNFYVDINDCVRSGDPCGADLVTIEFPPAIFFVA